MYCTDKYSQFSSIIWSVWANGCVFVNELSGCGFESRCSHLKVAYNDIEIYSAQNARKSVVAGRFIRTLKNKIYNYMTSMFKNLFVDKLDDTIHEYNDAYHTSNINPVDVKSNTYIDFTAEKIIKILNLKFMTI